MSNQHSKKSRKQENRVFQSDWEEKYFQIEVDNKAHCLLCPVVISSVKSFNIKRHYKLILQNMIATKENQGKGSWNLLSRHGISKQICSRLVLNLRYYQNIIQSEPSTCS